MIVGTKINYSLGSGRFARKKFGKVSLGSRGFVVGSAGSGV